MSDYIGHARIREALEQHLPAVTVFTGPPGVGKRTLARHLLDFHEVGSYDRLWLEGAEVSVGVIRTVVVPFVVTAVGRRKVVVLDLEDAPAFDGVQHTLLKTLEEPPMAVRFILVSARPLLPTILSRARVFRFGMLTAREITQILVQQGIEAPKALTAAQVSGGSVRDALVAVQGAGAARERVVAALREVARGSTAALVRVFREWGEPEHRLLLTWAAERAAGRWRVFTAQDAALGKDHAQFLLSLLARYSPARSRIADRAALEDLAGVCRG